MGPWVLRWVTMGQKGETQGMGSPEWGDCPGPQPGPLPAHFSREVKSTVSSRPCLFCLTTPRSSQQLLQALDSNLNTELGCTKGPLFHGGRNSDVRVMLLESSEENPQLTWTWTTPYSPASLR